MEVRLVVEVEEDLKKQVWKKAIDRGLSLKEAVVEALEHYLNDEKTQEIEVN